MPSDRRKARLVASLALVILAGSVAQAGPISDMITRHRTQRAMKLPPMDKPFSTKPVRSLNATRLSDRFKQRFSVVRAGASSATHNLFSGERDPGVIKVSH